MSASAHHPSNPKLTSPSGLKDNPTFILGPLRHALIQHHHAPPHPHQSSQVNTPLPLLPSRQSPPLLPPHPNPPPLQRRRGCHQHHNQRKNKNNTAHLPLLQKDPKQHLQSPARHTLRARLVRQLRCAVHDAERGAGSACAAGSLPTGLFCLW